MAGEWPRVRLAEAVDFLAGFAFKSEFYAEEDLGPRLCLGANVAPGAPDWSKLRYWPRAMCEGVERYFLADGDVVLAMDRPWIPGGLKVFRFAEVDGPALLVQRVARLRGTSLLDSGYLHAVLRHPAFTDYILGVQTGTTVPHISAGQILGYEIDFPPMSEQRRIAAILGALDDKIELNRKMNRTLEEMAQAIFKSWFIDFDGHDDLVDSEIGPVPRGWEPTTLGKVIDIFDRLRIPLSGRERANRQGPFPYYGAASVMDYVDAYLFDGIYVLVGEDGSVVDDHGHPITQYVWGKFWVNNHAHVLLPKPPVGIEHLLLALKNANIRPFMTGAVQAKVSQGNLRRVPFLLAPRTTCEAFSRVAEPVFDRLRVNTEESHTLASLRDTLLPKLISGEIRVPEAEDLVEAAS